MNKLLKVFSGTFISALLLQGCSNESEGIPLPEKVSLLPEVSISREVSTRVTDTHFQEGEEVAFLLLTPSGTLYNTATGYDKYTYLNRRWESSKPTILTNDEVRVFTFFPWSASLNYAQHAYQVPIETTSQTDYLTGKQVDGSFINAQNPVTRVNMIHALAKIRFTIARGTYPGVGKVTSAEFTNTEGTLLGTGYKIDLRTGTLITDNASVDRNQHKIGTWGEDGIILSSVPHGPEGTSRLLIPGNGKIKISLTIDNVEYSVICNLDGSASSNGYPRTLLAGSVYTINLRMSGSSLNIGSDTVILNNWYNSGAIGTH